MVSLLAVLAGVTGVFGAAYVVHGRYMRRLFELDGDRPTPAHSVGDDTEYVPASRLELFGHHFSSIAGGAPIVGPITAALAWGWAPALAWIVLGTIVFGATNDLAVLTTSVRHDGRSIGHVVGEYLGDRAKSLLLALAFIANLLVIGVLSLVVAVVFDAYPSAATASVIYIGLAALFGAARRAGVSLARGTLLFVPAVFAAVGVGLEAPLVLVPDGGSIPLPTVVSPNVSAWLLVVLLYAFVASVLPVWALLQPRDYLSSYLLYAGLGGAVVAVVVGTAFGTTTTPLTLSLAPFTGFMSDAFGGIGPLAPMLFPTIFCGAVCGLHTMVCCGTTPKMLDSEDDAVAIGYGTTLAEGVLAVVAIGTVAVIPTVPDGAGIGLALPSFARGGALILSGVGIPRGVGAPFMALVLSAFALTTVDTSIRLGRYFTRDAVADASTSLLGNRYLNAGVQALLAYALVASGGWATVWPLFGSSVQLFAGLSMLGVAVWLVDWDTTKEILSIGLSAAFILATSASALLYLGFSTVRDRLLNPAWLAGATPVTVASTAVRAVAVVALLVLAAEVIRITYRYLDRRDRTPEFTLVTDD